MKTPSSFLSLRLIRHLSNTATTTAATTTTITTVATNPSPTSISISSAKSKLRKEHDPDKALQIYSSVSNHYSSPVSSRYAQELTVQRLAKARRFEEIEHLIESQKNSPKITQEPYLCTLIRCYGKAGMFDQAIRLYGEMEELGTPRSCVSFNALMSAANNSRLFDRALQLFDEMPKRYGFIPDTVSYGILIKAHCEKGNPEMGLKILGEMEENGVGLSSIAFTTVLDALFKKGLIDEAEKLWEEMVKKGFSDDVAAWNVRIGHAQGGEPEGVKGLIEEMDAAGLKPDTISYNYLLTCYCRNGRMDEAIKLFEELEASGFRPKAATFRTLIHYLCKRGDYGRGYDVFKRSVFHHKIPDFATLKVLVEGLVEKNMRKDAKGLIRTVKKKFPANVLNAWKKVEVELGLASDESCADSDGHQAQEAAR